MESFLLDGGSSSDEEDDNKVNDNNNKAMVPPKMAPQQQIHVPAPTPLAQNPVSSTVPRTTMNTPALAPMPPNPIVSNPTTQRQAPPMNNIPRQQIPGRPMPMNMPPTTAAPSMSSMTRPQHSVPKNPTSMNTMQTKKPSHPTPIASIDIEPTPLRDMMKKMPAPKPAPVPAPSPLTQVPPSNKNITMMPQPQPVHIPERRSAITVSTIQHSSMPPTSQPMRPPSRTIQSSGSQNIQRPVTTLNTPSTQPLSRPVATNMQQSQQTQSQRQHRAPPSSHAEQSARKEKERFLMFTRVLMKYLEQKQPDLHRRAKEVIKECAEKNKQNHPEYTSLTRAMRIRLKETVGDVYWKKADEYLEHYLKQKEQQRSRSQKPGSMPSRPSSSSQPSSRNPSHQVYTSRPTGGVSSLPPGSQAPNPLSVSSQPRQPYQPIHQPPSRYGSTSQPGQPPMNKPMQTTVPKNVMNERQQENHRKAREAVLGSGSSSQNTQIRTIQPTNVRKTAPTPVPSINPKQQMGASVSRAAMDKKSNFAAPSTNDKKRRTSNSTVTVSSTDTKTTVSTKNTTSTPAPESQTKKKEYEELMLHIDNSADYNWKTAAFILSKEHLSDLDLQEEQKMLIYGKKTLPSWPKVVTEKPSERANIRTKTWHDTNILSSRKAWAKLRLKEEDQFKEKQERFKRSQLDGVSVTYANNQNNPSNGKFAHTWLNEDKATNDKALALISEATESYLLSLLKGAVNAARQRQNIDAIRLWHMQHVPTRNGSGRHPIALRLGCDVKRQLALAEGNAAMTTHRLEEVLSRKAENNGDDLNYTEEDDKLALINAHSMSDLSKHPAKLPKVIEQAEKDSKRSFDIYQGKRSGEPPFGRVPKKSKIIVKDVESCMDDVSFPWKGKGATSIGFAR